ncbi:MAG: three-Cys-motif partner protein TcmP [Gemmatimonadota bacterium]|nr:three-Cys-motif partner protein TcmP [Gemmatimonadota bacterium]
MSKIGIWSEVKLDILRDYASAYSRILAAQQQPPLQHIYIDAFSGSGVHQAKGTGELVWGSPTSVLLVEPAFTAYHFIDLDRGNIEALKEMVMSRSTGPYDPSTVRFYNGDCNDVLLSKVFPTVNFKDYRRALCLLDPYGLHLDWQVIQTAGQMRSIEVFLNFPIHDMNRNVLFRDSKKADPKQVARLTRYWGDESWRDAAYSTQGNLFGLEEKTRNEVVVGAFRDRLKEVAGFKHVSPALAMRNSKGATLYYLLFASQKPVAAKIVEDIFGKHGGGKG